MREVIEPNWMRNLPNDAQLSGEEIKKLYGYAPGCNATDLVRNGHLPEPTRRLSTGSRKSLWQMGYLRKLWRVK